MKNNDANKETTMETGTRVVTWTGDEGTIEYQTADGWYGVRDAMGGLDEWQGWQIKAV